jgi:hypothetical protein
LDLASLVVTDVFEDVVFESQPNKVGEGQCHYYMAEDQNDDDQFMANLSYDEEMTSAEAREGKSSLHQGIA